MTFGKAKSRGYRKRERIIFTDGKYRVSFYDEKIREDTDETHPNAFLRNQSNPFPHPPNSVGASGSYWLLAAFN